MKKRAAFVWNTLGWLMLFIALFMGSIRAVGDDPGLYFKYQSEAQILNYAGVSREDLLQMNAHLADYLFGRIDSPNLELPVYGQIQPAFNEKELIHLDDCRKLLAPAANLPLNVFLAAAGIALALSGKRGRSAAPAWTASAIILLPIAMLGIWAVIDFNSAFNFFHKILFTNDLWLLDPRADLLIRICPATMFAGMGLRIALMTAGVLLGLPLVVSLLCHLSERKRKTNETDL